MVCTPFSTEASENKAKEKKNLRGKYIKLSTYTARYQDQNNIVIYFRHTLIRYLIAIPKGMLDTKLFRAFIKIVLWFFFLGLCVFIFLLFHALPFSVIFYSVLGSRFDQATDTHTHTYKTHRATLTHENECSLRMMNAVAVLQFESYSCKTHR